MESGTISWERKRQKRDTLSYPLSLQYPSYRHLQDPIGRTITRYAKEVGDKNQIET